MRGFPTRWFTDPSGRSHWNFTTVQLLTGWSLSGSRSMKAMAPKARFYWNWIRKAVFIGEVPTTMTGWLKKPKSRTAADGSLSRTTAKRCKDRQRHPQSSIVQQLLQESPRFTNQQWERLPHQRWRQRADGLGSEAHDDLSSRWQTISSKRWHLLIARNPLKPEEVKILP